MGYDEGDEGVVQVIVQLLSRSWEGGGCGSDEYDNGSGSRTRSVDDTPPCEDRL